MQSTTQCETCPHCGRPYPYVTIPAFMGVPERRVQRRVCGCDGARKEEYDKMLKARQDALTRAWNGTGVPKRYRDVKPNYDELEAMEASGTGIYAVGEKGTGKTRFACGVLKAYVSRYTRDDGWCSARFVSVSEWLDQIQDTYGNPRKSAEEVFARAAGPQMVVLDDMGKVNSRITDWTVGKLFRLVDERYNDQKVTVVTSQYKMSELSDRLTAGGDRDTPDALVSRLFETCRQKHFGGPDRRIHKELRNG